MGACPGCQARSPHWRSEQTVWAARASDLGLLRSGAVRKLVCFRSTPSPQTSKIFVRPAPMSPPQLPSSYLLPRGHQGAICPV